MRNWSPATDKEVSSIIDRDLSECPDELWALFPKIQVPLRAVPISCFGSIESVYVVAWDSHLLRGCRGGL